MKRPLMFVNCLKASLICYVDDSFFIIIIAAYGYHRVCWDNDWKGGSSINQKILSPTEVYCQKS